MDYHQPVVSAFRPAECLRVLDYSSSMEGELRISMVFQMGIAKRCQESRVLFIPKMCWRSKWECLYPGIFPIPIKYWQFNGLVFARFTGKPPFLMGKSMVSCRFSLEPIHVDQYTPIAGTLPPCGSWSMPFPRCSGANFLSTIGQSLEVAGCYGSKSYSKLVADLITLIWKTLKGWLFVGS